MYAGEPRPPPHRTAATTRGGRLPALSANCHLKADEIAEGFVAAVDEALDRAQGFAERIEGFAGWKVNAYKNVEQLLNGEKDLDGADICSPHGLHHVLACELLEGGVNVLVEKPIGITVKASKKIIQTAKRRGLVAATAEQCRRSIGQRMTAILRLRSIWLHGGRRPVLPTAPARGRFIGLHITDMWRSRSTWRRGRRRPKGEAGDHRGRLDVPPWNQRGGRGRWGKEGG